VVWDDTEIENGASSFAGRRVRGNPIKVMILATGNAPVDGSALDQVSEPDPLIHMRFLSFELEIIGRTPN
jgi:hypothetical protein